MKLTPRKRALLYNLLLLIPSLILFALIPLVYWAIPSSFIASLIMVGLAIADMIWLFPRYRYMLFDRLFLPMQRTGQAKEFLQSLQYAGFEGGRNGYWILAAFDMGDYQFAVNACTYQLEHPGRHRPNKYFLLHILAEVYLRENDTEKLTAVCDAYDRLLAKEPKPWKAVDYKTVFARYRAYLDKDEAQLQKIIEKHPSHTKAGKSATAFLLGCFARDAQGDGERATALFKEVMQTTPDNMLARHADHAIACIARNVPYTNNQEPILPDEQFVPRAAFRTRAIPAVRVVLLTLAAVLAISVTNPLVAARDYKQIMEEIDEAAKRNHVKAQALTYVETELAKDEYFCLCLYEQNGTLYVGEPFVYANTPDVMYLNPVTSLPASSIENADELTQPIVIICQIFRNVYAKLQIYRNIEDVPNAVDYHSFEWNGQTYYFVLLEVKKL